MQGRNGESKFGAFVGGLPADEGDSSELAPVSGIVSRDDEETVIAGIFRGLADAEDQLSAKAQGILEGMGRGPAAELMGKVVDKGAYD